MALWADNEFEDELWGISENQNFRDFDPSPPPSILAWNAKVSKNNTGSVFDTHFEENVVISGRGRGRRTIIIQPGLDSKNEYDYNDDSEIIKRIRETSGIGYSNDLIKQIHRTEIAKRENNSPPPINETVKLTPSKKKLNLRSSSRNSSPVPSNYSGKSSISDTDIPTSNGPTRSIQNFTALVEKNCKENGKNAPIPLSQMLSRAKHEKKMEKNDNIIQTPKKTNNTWGTKPRAIKNIY